MDIKNNTKQKGLGKGFLLERKQRISIEGRGDMYIKNTQTQVRELFGREHAEKSRRTSSSSRKDTKLLSTSVQVDALHKKIESEIGKLKNFRKSFLRDTSGKPEKQTQILTGQYEEFNFVDNSVAANWREVLNLEIESPETRNTMRVLSSPQSGSSIDCYTKPQPDGIDGQLVDPSNQPITRMCGGCNKGYCDAASGSYSIYQTDYCHQGSPCSRRLSDCQQCYPGNANCLTCNMSGAGAVPMPVSYSSNPCYQYPVGALYQKLDMFMPQRNGCQIYTCNCPRNSYCKRTTDLNTADFCCNWYPDPVATVNRVVNSKEIPQSKFQFTPQQPMQAGGKEKGKSDSPPKSSNKIIKISYKHQKGGLKDSAQVKEKNKVSTKKYVTAKKKPEEVVDVNAEKLRMHRKYMEMYKTEHKKTANKDSSQNNSELDTCPTYTKLPVQEGKDAELSASYIKELGPSTKQNQITPTHQSLPEIIKECAEQLQPVEQINITGDMQHIMQNFNAESKSYKLKTLSIKRNDILEKLAPITHELTVLSSPDTDNINDGLIWPQLTPEIQLPSARSQQSPVEENRSDIRSRQLNNQYCQMSSKNRMSSDRVVPSEKTKFFNMEDTQADIQLNHPQLLTTLISNQSSQTSPRNQTSPSLNVWSYRAQSQVQETQTDIRDDKESQQIRSDQGTNILNTPTNQNLKLNCKKASTFREETTFSKYDKEYNGNKQQKEPKICSARNVSKIDKSQITASAICARNFIPWHTLRRREGNRRMIENYNLMIQHKRIESLHPQSESIQSITDKTLTATNHKDGNRIDIDDQTNLPAVSVNSDYKSISQYTELNNKDEQNDNGRIESNTNLMSSNGPMRNRNKSMPVHSIVHTMQPSHCFNPCETPCTFENNSGPSTSQQQAIIEETVCTDQCVRQRHRRSVTFQDESGLSHRSVIDWELLPKLSMERDTAGAQIPLDDTDDDLLDSYRSSSTANTEFTCNESNYEDEYSNFNESFREYIPPFTGCPCMYNKYLRLVAKCKASN